MTRLQKDIFSTLCLTALLLSPLSLHADEQRTGPRPGTIILSIFYLPVKATTVAWGLTSGAMSYVLSGGNAELTRQIWRDTTEGPYLITPEIVRASIGERPELEKNSAAAAEVPPKTD